MKKIGRAFLFKLLVFVFSVFLGLLNHFEEGHLLFTYLMVFIAVNSLLSLLGLFDKH